MEDIPFSAQLLALIVLLVLSGFFALSETALMAANRYRLRTLAQSGDRGAILAVGLLGKTDKLLGIILLFNTLINAAAATLVGLVTVQLFGEDKWVVGAGTLAVTFLILVFSEITPKVVGAGYPDTLATRVSFVLNPLLKIFNPAISLINLFVAGLLKLARLRAVPEHEQRLSLEELRTVVLESSHFIPDQHRSILLNLFDLEAITVEDVMTPRSQIEAINLADPIDTIRQELATSYHTRVPVVDGSTDSVVGVLHLRRVLGNVLQHDLSHAELQEMLAKPYFIPSSTPVYSQLQFFQENRERLGLVVDEYGELLGLVTLEDIIEEIIGKFTTSTPDSTERLAWDAEDSVLVDGSQTLRALNRKLGLPLPLDGPKTLNGLLLEHLQDIPDGGLSVKIAGVPIEVVQTEDRRVKTARVFRPAA